MNKNIIIIGGTRGIGLSISNKFLHDKTNATVRNSLIRAQASSNQPNNEKPPRLIAKAATKISAASISRRKILPLIRLLQQPRPITDVNLVVLRISKFLNPRVRFRSKTDIHRPLLRWPLVAKSAEISLHACLPLICWLFGCSHGAPTSRHLNS